MASSTATLLSVLHAIEQQNKKRSSGKGLPSISGSSGGVAAPSDTGGRGVVNPTTSKQQSHHSGGHHSNNPLSILGNLAGDVKDAALGIPGGIVQTIEHPVGTAEAIGKDYKKRYGPLFGYLNGGGDIGKFGQELADHPLAPLLDAASMATGGGALAAKVGQAGTVGRIVDAAHAAEAAKGVAQLTEKTAPLRTTIDRLKSKSAKITVDKNAAEARVNDLKAPVEVQASSAKALTKHETKLAEHDKMIEDLHKQIAQHEAEHAASTTSINGTAKYLEKLRKATAPRIRKIGGSSDSVTKEISVAQSGNPVKRLRQNLGLNVQESRFLPDSTPLIGLGSRAKKAANLEHQGHMADVRHAQRQVDAAVTHMEQVSKKTGTSMDHLQAATQAILDDVAPKDYATTVKNYRAEPAEIQSTIAKGGTQDEHHAFTQQVIAPHMSKRAAELYRGVKQAFQQEALREGRHIDAIHTQVPFDEKLINSPEVQAIKRLQEAHSAAAESAMQQLVKSGKLTKDEASKQAVLHLNLSRAARGKKEWTPEEAAAHFEKAGLPAPVFNPDTLTIGEAGKRGALKESQGIVYQRGTRSTSPRNIIARHEMASKITDMRHAHLMMLSVAKHIEGNVLPKDHVWVKDAVAPSLHELQAKGIAQLADGVPVGEDYYNLLQAESKPKNGMAISKAMQHDIIEGRKAMSEGRSQGLTKAMTAWKYATLATRPGFLLTNLLSNTFMTALKSSWNFPAMLRTREALKSGVFDEYHHAEGTTYGSSEASLHGKSRLAKGISKAANSMYTATGWHEHQMRQLIMYDTARRLPGVKAEMRRLKGGKADVSKQTLFHQAYAAAVKKNPAIRGLVTRNMDDALGNYRYFTSQEKMLKNLSPFYSWERHSVRNMVRMYEDNPATMAILTEIGMQGDKRFKRDFGTNMPQFVRSYIEDNYIKTVAAHLGMGDKVNMYDFNSVNPYTTAIQVGEIAGGGKQARDAALGMMGPLVTGPLETITGKNALTGAPAVKTNSSNPILETLQRIAMETPPYTVGQLLTTDKGSKKKLLPENKAQTVYRTMGLYFKHLDKKRASDMNTSQNAPKDKFGHVIKKKKKASDTPYPNAS